MINLPLPINKLLLENNTYFTGTVHRAEVASSPDNTFKVFQVRFQASARTFWHTHSGPQRLIVLEGTCIVQREGQTAVILKEGRGISLPANERHWHGAVSTDVACHLAINDDVTTTWLEAVSDDDYQAALKETANV
jgi:quercetin dioxygenase-like cupin family protein